MIKKANSFKEGIRQPKRKIHIKTKLVQTWFVVSIIQGVGIPWKE